MEATRLDRNMYTSGAEIAEENSRTRSFGEESMLSCEQIHFDNHLLPQANICCGEVMQNNEMTPLWPNHCWMPVASEK